MIFWKDVLARATAAVATAGLGAIVILPAVYPAREAVGYLPGVVQSYELRVGSVSAQGFLAVRLDQGTDMRVRAAAALAPGEKVCVRAVRRGSLIDGHLVPMDRCTSQ
jgi:hypothetical protein